MRDYQAKKSDYYLPGYAYGQALAVVRAYPGILQELDGGRRHDRIVTMTLRHQAEVVERALAEIPEEYRTGVLDNILERVSMDRLEFAGRNTWSRWRGRFLWEVARNLHLV